ncbi:MAG: RNA methyltransferase [Candidatus Cloacimonadota bacterium]|nr:RNA methyltransferase [Candidatus Cloacimonadota bacterium]
MINNLFLGLVHYPVYNKHNETVSTSITNLDVHDISRTCLTYGVKQFFIINPQDSQRQIFFRLKKFWDTDIAKEYNISRFNAFNIIKFSDSIEEATKLIKMEFKTNPILITTSARSFKNTVNSDNIKNILQLDSPKLILFGTAHGLTEDVIEKSDFLLEKISGVSEYNHLSVRSAVAITLDRLFRVCK